MHDHIRQVLQMSVQMVYTIALKTYLMDFKTTWNVQVEQSLHWLHIVSPLEWQMNRCFNFNALHKPDVNLEMFGAEQTDEKY